jgi:hypothetical protein
LTVIRAEINDAQPNPAFSSDDVNTGVLVWEQGPIDDAVMHVSPTVEGKNPLYNWRVPIYIANCEETITCKLGSFGDFIGEEEILASNWRDGVHQNGQTVRLGMGGLCTLYISGKWIE